MKTSFLNKRVREFSKPAEIAEVAFVLVCVFFVPLLLPEILLFMNAAHLSQYMVGTLVNCALILAGINFKGTKKNIVATCMPSLSALLGGLAFSIGNIYMLYMIPAIWLGNATVVMVFKWLYTHKQKGFMVAAIIAMPVKVAIVFGGYTILSSITPAATMLHAAMGINQLITAVLGSMLAFGFAHLVYKNKKQASK